MTGEEYTERLKEHIGEPQEGRTDYFNLTHEASINLIKEKLRGNFSVNLWTLDWPKELIIDVDKELTKNEIVHCWDEILDCFICFNSVEDMHVFYEKLKEELKNERNV